MSQIPGPPLTHTEPQLGKGAGPCAHSARGISGGEAEWRGLAQSRNNRTGGGGAPQVCVLILLSIPPLQEQSLERRGEGSASRESKDGGEIQALLRQSLLPSQGLSVRNCFAPPFSRCIFPFACRSWLWRSLQFANWGGGVVANRGRPLPCKPEGSLRCTRRQAGQARPGWAPTPWPLPPGHPRLLT